LQSTRQLKIARFGNRVKDFGASRWCSEWGGSRGTKRKREREREREREHINTTPEQENNKQSCLNLLICIGRAPHPHSHFTPASALLTNLTVVVIIIIAMNLQDSLLLLASVLLSSSSLAWASSLNLAKLQPISNFPTKCTYAYNADISSCTSSEITITGRITSSGKGVCSLQCLAGLSDVNANLSSACAGVRASPDTLIGLFFADKGIEYLCPNSVEGSGAPAPSSTSEDGSAASTSSTSDTDTETKIPTSTTTTSSSSSETTADPSPSPTFQPTTVVNNGVATTITSEAQRTEAANTNPDAFGGGGSPFEVAANGAASLSARRDGRIVGRNGVPAVLAAALFSALLMAC
jgi:hypothetical protein